MADRYLLESGAPDGYLLEDGTGVLLLEGGDTAADGSKQPFFQPRIARPRQNLGFATTNLLLTTLAVVSAPILNSVLPNPRPAPRAQQQVTQPNLALQQLNVAAAPPGAASMDAPPRRRAMAPPLHWSRSIADAAVEALPPGEASLDPPSRRVLVRNPEYAPNLVLLAVTAVEAQPPGESLDGVPPRRAAPRPPEPSPNLTLRHLTAGTPPIVQREWQSPPKALAPRTGVQQRNDRLLDAVVTPPPIAQVQWPNPIRARLGQTGVQQRNDRLLDAPPAVDRPIVQTDWPLPPRALPRPRPLHFKAELNAEAPPTPPLDVPIRQQDWPLPRRANWMTGQEVLLVSYQAPSPGPLPPGLQFDWPLPPPRKPQPRGFVAPNLNLTTLFVAQQTLPFNQFHWPLPMRPRIGQVNYTFTGTPLPNEIPIVIPSVPSSYVGNAGGGGGGGEWYKGKKRRPTVYDALRKDLRSAVIDDRVIRDVYAELMESAAADQAADALRTYAKDYDARAPKPEEIDWDGAVRDVEAVAALLQAAKAEELRRQIEADDEEMMMF